MKIEIIARTCEMYHGDETGKQLNDIGTFAHDQFILGGRAGGTCYAKEGYFDKGIYNTDRAERIAKITSGSGHHSVFEHSYITLLIGGIPKILAMLLNSTSCYVTSEKSARYTVMSPVNEIETEMYNKWVDIFKKLIVEEYGNMNLTVDKLAMENARYMISVFTPTSMVYTVSYRQICYLIEWLDDFCKKAKENSGNFYSKVADGASELHDELIKIIGGTDYLLKPNKCESFRFFATLNGHSISDTKEFVSDAYTLKYKVSFPCLAQIQRHRTTHCEMFFDDKEKTSKFEFYLPKIIRNKIEYKEQWIEDLHRLVDAGVYPQAMLIDVVERGLVTDYLMKCQERLCARAQLEITDNTIWGMYTLKYNRNNMSEYVKDELNKWFDSNDQIKFKCEMKKCVEPCVWGAAKGKNRLI